MGKDVGQDGAAYAVPGAGDGAGNHSHRVGGHKESHCQVGAQTGVLHAHLDGDRAFLGRIELEHLSHVIAQHVTYSVVAEHHTESEQEQHKAVLHQRIVNRSYHAAHNAGQTNDRYARHTTARSYPPCSPS